MSKRSFNPRLIKINRSYLVTEVASVFGIHKNSVLVWIKQGLPIIDSFKPYLIHGDQLCEFIKARRNKYKCKCLIDEIYCVKCRMPQKPLGNMVDYSPSIDGSTSNIMGLCPDCGSRIYRRTSVRSIELIRAYLDVTIPIAN